MDAAAPIPSRQRRRGKSRHRGDLITGLPHRLTAHASDLIAWRQPPEQGLFLLCFPERDALYPDYVGSFYYRYGDHADPDGARAEGLLAAYQLAIRVGDQVRAERNVAAVRGIAAATLQLCNTPDSVYAERNRERSIGGIRFKFTRQWFRVDTIPHVACFCLNWLLTEPAISS